MKKVLIVGAGRIAGLNEGDPYREKPCTHAGAYIRNENFDLCGIVDIELEKAKDFAEKFNLDYYSNDIHHALNSLGLDLVSIAIPYKFNKEIIHRITSHKDAPHMIFCEKPIANSLGDAEYILEICEKKGIQLFSNNRRLTSVYLELKNVLKVEFNNEIISINSWCSSGLHAIGIHMIELIRMIAGEIEWVSAIFEKEYVESLPFSANFTPDDQRVNAHIGFKNGVIGNFVNSALTKFTYFEIEILCRNGKIRVSDNGNCFEIFKPVKPGQSTLSYKLNQAVTLKPKSNGTLFENIACSLSNADAVDLTHPLSGKHAVESYRVLHSFIESAQSGKQIYLN